MLGIKVTPAAGVGRKIPTEPGRYWWSEWNKVVEVYRKKNSRYLYVTPPRGVEVRVSHKIAGTFLKHTEIASLHLTELT